MTLDTMDDRLRYAVAVAASAMPDDLRAEQVTLAQLSPDDAEILAVDQGDGSTAVYWIGRFMALVSTRWLAVCATCPVRQQCRRDGYAGAEGGVPLRVRFGLPGTMKPN